MKYELIAPVNKNYSTIQQVLTNRGIKLEDVELYLHPRTEINNLPYTLLKNIQNAVEMFMTELRTAGTKIHIQVD